MRRREHQSGFGTTVVLLAVLVVAVLAVTGLVAYQHHKSSSAKNMTTTQTAQTTAQPKSTTTTQPAQMANQNIFKIPELGIELIVPDSIKDLTYAVFGRGQVNGQPSVSVGLSTTALVNADSGCVPGHAPLGTLSKTNGQYPANATASNSSGSLIKQFSTYYIARIGPQSACSGKTNVQDEQTADNQTIASLNLSTALKPLQ